MFPVATGRLGVEIGHRIGSFRAWRERLKVVQSRGTLLGTKNARLNIVGVLTHGKFDRLNFPIRTLQFEGRFPLADA